MSKKTFTAIFLFTTTVWASVEDPFHTDNLTAKNQQTSFIDGQTLISESDITAAQQAVTKLPNRALSLAEITDFALANNPLTRLAWLQAKAAAANVGIAKGAYWPQLNVGASAERSQDVFTSTPNIEDTYGANISLSYLLWDFGQRASQLNANRYTLLAANLNQNSQIQAVISQTQQAYYLALGQQALIMANQKSVAEAKTSLAAAQALRQHGMATIGDVYQAQASLAQTNLNLEQSKGGYQTAMGQLATTMGLPANARLRLTPLNKTPVIHPIHQEVELFLAKAKRQRPDLLAASAQVHASESQLNVTQTSTRPTLQLSANTMPNFSDNENVMNGAIALNVSMPLFTGYTHTYQVKQAKAQLEETKATQDELDQQVQLQVWQAYYALKTAQNSIANTDILLKSSEQSVKQAMGQYKAGVGNILTVLTTQSSLASARVQSIQARLNWYVALAQLTQAVGVMRL
jgi:outer membrane protein